MKPQMKAQLLAAAVATYLAACGIAQASDECSESTLRGVYHFSASGFNIVSGVAVPKAIIESIRFNGDGTLTVPSATVSINGVITTSPPGGVGTYTVAPDCTGTLQFGPPGPAFALLISPKGDAIELLQTGGAVPAVFQGQANRASH